MSLLANINRHLSSHLPYSTYLLTSIFTLLILIVSHHIMIRNSTNTLKSLASKATSRMYSTVEKGTAHSANYRVYFKNSQGQYISPFHDIPLVASGEGNSALYNMVVEIPRWSNAKMEIATKEVLNPIKQDVKKGKLRYVHNCFPYHGYIWNYGALPQTWENPSFLDPHTKAKGDNDPIDVCEIGSKTLKRGEVVPVKVLGVMALIDDGETDWKLIVIKADDPLANKLNDIKDVEQHMPGLLKATHEWFKIYKIPDGKPANEFAFDGQAKGVEFARNIIKETHEQWEELIKGGKHHELALENAHSKNTPVSLTEEASKSVLSKRDSEPTGEVTSQQELEDLSKITYVKV